jgi:ferredoxin
MRIEVDRELCAGMAICTAIAPDVFELDDEGKAVVVDSLGADSDTIVSAAQDCPLDAIVLYNDEGERIWPV